jgi:hypothetical protein
MASASTPTPKDVARALHRLTADQFTQVCSEIGYPEVTLPGSTQAAKATALVERTQGGPDFVVLVRAVNRVDPNAWRSAPARRTISSFVYGLIAFFGLLLVGGLVLVLVLSGTESAAEISPTPTETLAPTRTPVPTITHTPSLTLEPSATLTPSLTATPSRAGPATTPTAGSTSTHTPTPPPPVSIIYPAVEPQRPQSGTLALAGATVEFRWILRDFSIAADERYLMRLYAGDNVVDNYLTSDPWRFYPVPLGAIGDFTWTVTVVKVDDEGHVIGPLSPESDPWKISLQP